jgi:molecular chaperone DnaJ
MTIRDCYLILGVPPKTTMEEVRRRYRALARQYHPDHHPDDPQAATRFRRLVEAYETIQQSRARHRTATENLRRPQFTENGELFEEFFGFSGQSRVRQSAGADFRYDLQISLAAALRGTQTVIQVDRLFNCRPCQGTGRAPGSGYVPCPQCQGRGRRYGGPGLLRFGPICPRCHGQGQVIAHTCAHCQGQGLVPGIREYRLDIAPGTEDGARLRLTGEGGEGFHQGPPGNLEVVIHVAPDEFFVRQGADIHCQIKVSCAEANRGACILVPTLDGYQTLQLPRGAQSGSVFRLPGAGVPGGPGLPPGDQVMEILVINGNNLEPRQPEMLAGWAFLEAEKPTWTGHE